MFTFLVLAVGLRTCSAAKMKESKDLGGKIHKSTDNGTISDLLSTSL